MELEELKNTWQEVHRQFEKQKELNTKMIIDMTRLKYTNKLKTISTYEGLGAIVLLGIALFIFFNFRVFDTIGLQISATLSLIIMFVLPVLSLRSIYRMTNLNIGNTTQKALLTTYAKRKSHFLFVQKLGIALSFVMVFTIMPVTLKIFKGKDLFAEFNYSLLWFIPFILGFLFFFIRWGYNCYINITNDAEKLLKELKEEE